MRPGAIAAQAETSNVTATDSKRGAEVSFKTWELPTLVLIK